VSLRAALVTLALAVFLLAGGAGRVQAGCNPNREFEDAGARWSPDDRWIAFYRVEIGCGGPIGMWVVRTDGTHLRRLGNGGRPSPPTWSPDGRLIAFAGSSGIVTAESQGRGLDNLTTGPDFAPAWSPDGKRIAFRRGATPDAGLWVMNADGSGQRQLVASLHDLSFPAWSPDSRSLAYVAAGGTSSEDVWVLDVGTGAARDLTPTPVPDRDPTWSPGGDYLAFDSGTEDDRQVYVIRPDGGGLAPVTTGPGPADHASFGRSEGRLAYLRHGPTPGLYMTSGYVQEEMLSARADILGSVSWSNAGHVVAFSAGGECFRFGIYLLDVDASPRTEKRLTNPCTFRGTRRADTLRGTPFRDFLYGFAGDDHLAGLDGQDGLSGGPGDDVLIGGRGADTILGGTGRDRVSAGDGKDSIFVRDGRSDRVFCGAKTDVVYADRLDVVAHDCERVLRR
jgi:Ca2+-binding RTX toxin-like protein